MPHTGHATRATPVWALKLAVVTGLVGIAGGIAGVSVWLALQLIQFVAFGYGFGGHHEAADAPSALNRFLALVAAVYDVPLGGALVAVEVQIGRAHV